VTAATGSEENADRAMVDARGIAAIGTVSRVELTSGTVTANVNDCEHSKLARRQISSNRTTSGIVAAFEIHRSTS
jgi:hypothetical protein